MHTDTVAALAADPIPALAGFLAIHSRISLAVLLAFVLVAALVAARILPPTIRTARALPGYASPLGLLLRLAAGFGVIVLAASGFAEIADEIVEGGDVVAFDETLALAIGRHPDPLLTAGFAAITRLADTLTLSALCVVGALILLGMRRRALALAWTAAIAGNALLNTTLKQVFERVRPVHDDALVIAHGWSFPSGHSSGAVAAYGMLVYLLLRMLPPRWHPIVLLLGASAIVLVGASRIWLRVHFASDVAAGFLSGSAWLLACILSLEYALRAQQPERRTQGSVQRSRVKR